MGLFAEEERLKKLSELGDNLEKLSVIDWELFRPTLERARFNIGLTNLVYNLFRYTTLLGKRVTTG